MSGIERLSDAGLSGIVAGAAQGSVPVLTGGRYAAASVPGPGPVYNLTAANIRKLKRGFARVRSGTSPCTLFVAGDSMSVYSDAFSNNWPSQLAGLLNTHLIPCAQTWAFPRAPASSSDDPRFVPGSGWDVTQGNWVIPVSSTTGTYTPNTAGYNGPAYTDSVDIWFLRYSGKGTLEISVGGSVVGTVVTAGATATMKQTITFTRGTSNVISIRNTSGSGDVYLLAVNAYDSTTPQVQIANCAIGGTYTSNWIPSGNLWTISHWSTIYTPDCTIIDLGTNDANTPLSVASYMANVATIKAQTVTDGGDLIWKSMIPSGQPANRITYEPLYNAALQALTNVPLFDCFTRFESYAISNALGYYNGDQIHPTKLANADIAGMFLDAFSTL